MVPGGWEKVPNSIQIEDLARFAVDEYNSKESAALVFVRVTQAYRKVVAGFLFRINLEATDDGETNYYVTEILEKAGEESAEVLEFKKLLGPPIDDDTGDLVQVPITPQIVNLARFAVDEHNKTENDELEFVKAILAYKKLLIGGLTIYIILEATDLNGKNHNYQIKIFKGLDQNKELLEFFELVAPVAIDE